MARRDYVRRRPDGGGIVVHWDSRACVFSHVCVKVLPEVFDANRYPWVKVDAASEEEVVEAVALCRPGALRLSRFEAGEEPTLLADLPRSSEDDEDDPPAEPVSTPSTPVIPRQPGIPAHRG